MNTMQVHPLYCHTTCYTLECPVCGYSAGEHHYRDDADAENGELSTWANLRHSEGDACPNCGWCDDIEAALPKADKD